MPEASPLPEHHMVVPAVPVAGQGLEGLQADMVVEWVVVAVKSMFQTYIALRSQPVLSV